MVDILHIVVYIVVNKKNWSSFWEVPKSSVSQIEQSAAPAQKSRRDFYYHCMYGCMYKRTYMKRVRRTLLLVVGALVDYCY